MNKLTKSKGKTLASKATNGIKKSTSKMSNGRKKLAGLSLNDFVNSSDHEDEEVDSEEAISDEDSFEEGSDGEDVDDESYEEPTDDEEKDEGDEEDGEDDTGDDENGDSGSDDEDDSNTNSAAKKHKKTLEKLKDSDPEFYKFLSENDRELLEFDTSDSEDEERGGEVHELPEPEELAVGSDESDFEDEESAAKRQKNVITQAMVDKWQQELHDSVSMKVIADVVNAFRSAVHSVTEEKEGTTRFKVIGSAAFNSVVRLCIVDLIPALKKFLKCPEDSKNLELHKCKQWTKARMQVKSYLADVIRLLSTLSDSSLLSVMLKHIHQLVPFYCYFVKISRVLCKRLISIWCSAEDTIRVLAFLSILRLARTIPDQLLESIIKAMYMSYARNCKFTSPSTWPVINFMRRSLVEMLALQESVTYRHAFLYIRQLAIHLRNAITSKKKDAVATVYNWQFVHCLHLWAALLGALPDSQLLKPLVYPLVQVAMGAINLVPTAKYYPLRFHVVSIMNQLSVDTGVFIPVLPFLLEILRNYRFEKKPGKTSMKPLELSCALRVSQSQMAESGYRDAVVELLYDRVLDTLHCHSHSVAFPEMALPVIIQLKQFIKKCPLPNYTKKMKQLVDKVQETVQFVEKQRAGVHFELTDTKAAAALENQMKQSGNPLTAYHVSWKKMRDREMAIKIAKKPENDRDAEIPVVKKPALKAKGDGQEDDGEFDDLFPSDMSDDDDEDRFLLKEERGQKRKLDDQDESIKASAKKAQMEEAKKAKNKTLAQAENKKKKPTAVNEEEDEDMGDKVVDFDMSSEEDQESDAEEDEQDDDDDDDD